MITLLGYDQYLLRIVGAAVVSFLLVLGLGPKMIRFLIRRKLGDRPEFNNASLNELTRQKSNTPTMGGTLIVIAIFISVLIFGKIQEMYVKMALLAVVWLGGLGAVDDWLKLRYSAGTGNRDGLKMWEKLVFQIGLAVLLAVAMYAQGRHSGQAGHGNPAHSLYLPFKTTPVTLSLLAYVIIVIFTMVGSSNAVNLTDGMDGLAAGSTMIVSCVLLIMAWTVNVGDLATTFHFPYVRGGAEMTIVAAAVLGSCAGFLWYNAPPAQVFMGDTGSLPLGGLLGYIALVTRQEVLLLICGGVFVMEALSVAMQITYFKMTRPAPGAQGKRLFRCAPLHHHFHLGGWAETKVVVRFWLLGILFAALALATLKLR